MIFRVEKRLECQRDCHNRKSKSCKQKRQTASSSSIDFLVHKEDQARHDEADDGTQGKDKTTGEVEYQGNKHIRGKIRNKKENIQIF